MVRDVHATEGTSATPAGGRHVAVHDETVGEDVGEGAFGTKLAISLTPVSTRMCRDVATQ